MSDTAPDIRKIVGVAAVLAAVASIATVVLYPLNLSEPDWVIAFVVLLTLTLISQALALQINEAGSTTTMDFVPQLGAVLLLGPSGATLLTIFSWMVFQFRIVKNPPVKGIFNTAQMVTTVCAASWAFILSGGEPVYGSGTPATSLPILDTLPSFLAAVCVYFALNTSSVTYIISQVQGSKFLDVWNRMAGRVIVFDLAISPLALLVAWLYVEVGWITLLLALTPIIGLRYSYGVNLELQQLNTDLARVLIRTIESQDPYTGGHSLRVSRWATTLAEEANIGYSTRRNIETAALLHDIGKIDRVYFEILRHDGPLTEEQRDLIRAHPDRGVDMLSTVRSLDDDILKFVKHHHEHYNGKGYPSGLSGKDIPLGARVIMIADTIDAMMTQRPYRDPLPPEVVKEELLDKKGEQFDPDLVDTLIDEGVFDEMAEAYTTPGDHLPASGHANVV